jgi:hypothetical protein
MNDPPIERDPGPGELEVLREGWRGVLGTGAGAG